LSYKDDPTREVEAYVEEVVAVMEESAKWRWKEVPRALSGTDH
jgi:hypothetical protein